MWSTRTTFLYVAVVIVGTFSMTHAGDVRELELGEPVEGHLPSGPPEESVRRFTFHSDEPTVMVAEARSFDFDVGLNIFRRSPDGEVSLVARALDEHGVSRTCLKVRPETDYLVEVYPAGFSDWGGDYVLNLLPHQKCPVPDKEKELARRFQYWLAQESQARHGGESLREARATRKTLAIAWELETQLPGRPGGKEGAFSEQFSIFLEAEERYREAHDRGPDASNLIRMMQLYRETIGERHPAFLGPLELTSRYFSHGEHLSAARELLRQHLGLTGASPYHHLVLHRNLGVISYFLLDYKQAQHHLEEGLRVGREHWPTMGPLTLSMANSLSLVYRDLGRFGDAISLLESIRVRLGESTTENSSGHRKLLTNLSLAYEKSGQHKEASDLLEQGLGIQNKIIEKRFLSTGRRRRKDTTVDPNCVLLPRV